MSVIFLNEKLSSVPLEGPRYVMLSAFLNLVHFTTISLQFILPFPASHSHDENPSNLQPLAKVLYSTALL